MNSEIWQRVREVFERALDLPADRRTAFLDEACGDDREVRSEVEALLATDDSTEVGVGVLETGAFDRAMARLTPAVGPGDRIGSYRIVRLIGEGGMGSVYEAEQEEPRRTVALKVLRLGLGTEASLRRFRYEAQILGRLQHPNIAQVYEAGVHRDPQTGGEVPFFAMELVAGARALTAYADGRGLSIEERLGLMIRVCQAVQHGHQKGIVHRDLKPANVLVDLDGRPKVIDFGIARCTDSDIAGLTVETAAGEVLGTLHYMSPEQIRGSTDEIDTRADVYALGVVCFQLLTGRLPHDLTGTPIAEAARRIEEEDALPLSAVDSRLSGDLETVVAKATDKDRERRYASASDLALDLRNYLDHQPILARPPSTLYQLRKFARRNRTLVASVAVVLATLSIALVVVLQQMSEVRAERTRARQVSSFTSGILVESDLMRAKGPDFTLREALSEAADRMARTSWDDPEIEGELLATIGGSYEGLSLYEDSEPALQRAERLLEQAAGAGDPRTLAAGLRLALVWRAQGRVEEALERTAMLRAACIEALGARDPLTLSAGHNLAMLLKDVGRMDEADALYREVLEQRREVEGVDAPGTLQTLHNLGFLRLLTGRLEEARELLERCRDLRVGVLGEDHPDTLITIDVLGQVELDLGRNEAAQLLHRRAVEGLTRQLGPDHDHTLASRFHLLRALMAGNELEEALEVGRETLASAERVLGPTHPNTLKVRSMLGVAAVQAGELEEAEVLARGAYGASLESQGESHRDTVHAAQNLASVLHRRERYAEALEVLQGHESVPDFPEAHLAQTFHLRGMCHLDMGDIELAERALLRCYELAVSSWGPEHPFTARALGNLVEVYERLERPADAERYRKLLQAIEGGR